MSIVTIEIEAKNKKMLLDFYNEFMPKGKAQAFHSLDEFKRSSAYQDVPDKEREQLEQYNGKNVVILIFDDVDQALKFIEQIQSKGLISKDKADAIISNLNDQNGLSLKPGMS